MKLLKPGDPCPCCGQPILSRDPKVLTLLTKIAVTHRAPTVEEIQEIARGGEGVGNAGADDAGKSDWRTCSGQTGF